MSQVKNMPSTSTSLLQNPLRLLANHILLRKQHHRIEISHHRNVVTDTLPTIIQPHTPIESDHIATSFTHQLQQRRCSRR